jgi:hypothetical protein
MKKKGREGKGREGKGSERKERKGQIVRDTRASMKR